MSERFNKQVQALLFVTPLLSEGDVATQEQRLRAFAAERGYNVAAVVEMGVPTSVDALFLPIMDMKSAGIDVILSTQLGRATSRPTGSAAMAGRMG